MAGGVTGAEVGLALTVTAATGIGGVAGLALQLFAYVSASGFMLASSIVGALADHPRAPARRRRSSGRRNTAARSSAPA